MPTPNEQRTLPITEISTQCFLVKVKMHREYALPTQSGGENQTNRIMAPYDIRLIVVPVGRLTGGVASLSFLTESLSRINVKSHYKQRDRQILHVLAVLKENSPARRLRNIKALRNTYGTYSVCSAFVSIFINGWGATSCSHANSRNCFFSFTKE